MKRYGCLPDVKGLKKTDQEIFIEIVDSSNMLSKY